jgi:hypothetical protein
MSSEELEQRTERAYARFVEAAESLLPGRVHAWRELPEVGKKPWRAAIAAAFEDPDAQKS